MIFPAGMKKAEFLIFKTDTDAVIEYLGRARCFQVSPQTEGGVSENRQKLEALRKNLSNLQALLASGTEDADFSGERGGDKRDGEVPHTAREEDIALAEEILAEASPLIEEEKTLTQKRQKALSLLEEAAAFRKLDLPLKDIEAVTFLSCRTGFLPPAALPSLRDALRDRAFIIELDTAGRVLALSSKKGRFALDTELKNAGFRDAPVPDEVKNLPPEVEAALRGELAETEKLLQKLSNEKAVFADTRGETLRSLAESLALSEIVEELKSHLLSTETACVLSGWITSADSKKIIAGLEELTRGRIAVRVWEAEEVEAVKEGREKIPVKLQHGKLLESFSGIVVSYGSPLYGTVDPTAVVSFFFILLFAVMFGDVGQGFVGVLAGFALSSGKIRALRGWRKFAPVFKAVGLACMGTGFLYGSVFCNEHLLVPLTRSLTGRIFGQEMDRFITLLPHGGVDKLLVFFGFTLGIGVLVNSIGLIINIYNRFKLKDFRHAFFAKTGLAGAFLFWYAVFMSLRLGRGGVFGPADILCLGLPLLVLFWGEPLYRLIFRERPLFPEGVFSFAMEGCVEVMETISYFISNSVSFLRVGAFALSHAVLSLIIFSLAELLAQVPGGPVFQFLLIAAGNILIIFLEGLIVSIQVIRLQYYEFFSKFFTDSGEAFKPFTLASSRTQEQRESV